MGLISGLLGDASEADIQEVDELIAGTLIENETVEKAYQVIRDIFVFTNKRLILIDKQGLSGKKIEFLSIPYNKITKFSKEGAGTFDSDSELKIWVLGESTPIQKEFKKSLDINEPYRVLSQYILA